MTMQKIKHYQGSKNDIKEDSWDFHTNAVSRLKKGNHKTILTALEPQLEAQYDCFAEHFKNNTLELLQPMDLQETADVHPKKDALLKQYVFDKKVFRDLYSQLSTDSKGRKNALCPNCQVEEAHTLDHCLPKAEFPEFADHPLNLMLCCQDCNGRKNATWRSRGKRTQLNLYLDDIPDIQYLFVTVEMVDGLPVARYRVRQTEGIDDELYNKIEGHYGFPLNLCDVKFYAKTYVALSNFRSYLRPAYRRLPLEVAKQVLAETVSDLQQMFGRNYWEALLLEACAQNSDVWQWLMTKEEIVNPQTRTLI